MGEVTQSILHGDDPEIPGNCLQAAVASLLDRPLDRVPHFVWAAGDNWLGAVQGWARDNGMYAVYAHTDSPPSWPCVVMGPSPRGVSHSVVALGGEVVWDPHPSRAGIERVTACLFFEAIDAEASPAPPSVGDAP